MADFPKIRTGVITQKPYTSSTSYWNTKVVMPCGLQYSWKHRETPVQGRILTFGSIKESEATTLENFFRARRGRLESFNFTDPDTDLVFVMRFDQDDLVLRHLGPDEVATEVRLVEVPA